MLFGTEIEIVQVNLKGFLTKYINQPEQDRNFSCLMNFHCIDKVSI